MMKKIFLYSVVLILICCTSEVIVSESENQNFRNPRAVSVDGFFQKGPYLSGTKINLFELDENLVQNGRTFTTNITDNKGTYSFDNVNLSSNFVLLDGLGYYFNEVLGKNSQGQLQLSAYHKIKENSKANVNILTSLEKQRVAQLISEGKDFTTAKKQALSEILNNFNISEDLDTTSEYLNLSTSGNGNAILLAISSIIQGFRSDAEISEILSNMASDLKNDGIINSENTGSKLLSQALFLNANSIKNNLINKYSEMGENIEFEDFGSYLNSFIENSTFKKNHLPITYPEFGYQDWQKNALHNQTTTANFDDCVCSLRADFEVDGGLKIRISSINSNGWGIALGTNKNMNYNNPTSWTPAYKEQYFETPKNTRGLSASIDVFFEPGGTYTIDFFELGATEPTRSKTLIVADYPPEDTDSSYETKSSASDDFEGTEKLFWLSNETATFDNSFPNPFIGTENP